MKPRYCFEIAEDLSTHYCFSYMDTVDNLADFLFDHMKINVEHEMEFHYDDDPFKIVMCRVPRSQREDFLNAIDLLPGLMEYAGKTGYDAYCMDLMRNAARFIMKNREAQRISPLQ